MQSKSCSKLEGKLSQDLKEKYLKRKFDKASIDDDYQNAIKSKKIKILYDKDQNLTNKSIDSEIQEKLSLMQNDECELNESTKQNNEKSKNDFQTNDSNLNHQILDQKNDERIDSNSNFNKKLKNTKLDLIQGYHQNTKDSTYQKYYFDQMNEFLTRKEHSGKLLMIDHHNLEQREENEFAVNNQLNYVQLLNYQQCLMMQKSMEMSKNLSDRNLFDEKNSLIFDKNQLKSKIINYSSLNDQQISHLNSQLINSPGFKQLIEKNRTLRLNLAYQKLQVENLNFSCLPFHAVRPCRRQRTTFTNEQTIKLEIEYRQNEYISRNKRFQLSDLLNLSENQIKIWFQNRRAKDKRLERAILDQQLKQIWN